MVGISELCQLSYVRLNITVRPVTGYRACKQVHSVGVSAFVPVLDVQADWEYLGSGEYQQADNSLL